MRRPSAACRAEFGGGLFGASAGARGERIRARDAASPAHPRVLLRLRRLCVPAPCSAAPRRLTPQDAPILQVAWRLSAPVCCSGKTQRKRAKAVASPSPFSISPARAAAPLRATCAARSSYGLATWTRVREQLWGRLTGASSSPASPLATERRAVHKLLRPLLLLPVRPLTGGARSDGFRDGGTP